MTETDDITRHVRMLRHLTLEKRCKYLGAIERVLGKEMADQVRQAYIDDWNARRESKK